MVSAGSILTFTVRGTTQAAQFQVFFTPAMLRSEVVRVLSQKFEIVQADISTDDTIISGTLPWSYRGDVQVRTRITYAKAADVGSIVANAFFQAAGNMPTVTEGRDLDWNPPELSWKVVVAIGAAALLLIAVKFR